VIPVTDPILLFLAVDAVALLLLGACAAALPVAATTFLATMLSGLGMLLCVPPLLLHTAATATELPVGPPGLSLHLAVDPLSACFLLIVFQAGTALVAFQATATPVSQGASVGMTALCLAGAALSLLAADGVTLAIGFAITCGSSWLSGALLNHTAPATTLGPSPLPAPSPVPATLPVPWGLLAPPLVLTSICLLSPAGFSPTFDAIRTAPIDPNHAIAAGAVTLAAAATMIRGDTCYLGGGHRSWTRDALTVGVLTPSMCYLLLRLFVDLEGAAPQPWCGFVLLIVGGVIAIVQGWRAAGHLDVNGSVALLTRRQAGLAAACIGLAVIARSSDLPAAEALALAATCLAVLAGSVAGVLTVLAAQTITASAGTSRILRLGGLIHTMPTASAALAAGLFGLSALPPSLGFASLWLLFDALLSAPRTGGLLFQLPLALTGAAFALSAALASAAAVRLIGVALLGRPRTPQGAGAEEGKSPSGTLLLVLTTLSVLAGVLPGLTLWLMAEPAIRSLTGIPPRIGLELLLPSAASPCYLALPECGLLALATGAVLLLPRWARKESKTAGVWTEGMAPPPGLPFGEPAAQSVGEGFLPALPDLRLPQVPRLPPLRYLRAPSATEAIWLLLAAASALLLLLAMFG
jgi:hydrogenase-4 component B